MGNSVYEYEYVEEYLKRSCWIAAIRFMDNMEGVIVILKTEPLIINFISF